MGGVYRPANEEIDIRRFLKQHPADKTGTIVTIAPFLMAFVLIQHILGVLNDPADGDNAGFIHMGMDYLAADVTVKGGKMEVYAVKGVQQFDCDQAYTKETKELLASYDNLKEIYFRYTVKKTGTKDYVEGGLPVKEAPVETVTIEISTDGKEYTNPVSVIAKAGRWVGVKSGVYVSHDNSANSANKGFVTVDYVRYSR